MIGEYLDEYLGGAYSALMANKEAGLYNLNSVSMNMSLQELCNNQIYLPGNGADALRETSMSAAQMPGFESIFSMAILLATAYLVLGRTNYE